MLKILVCTLQFRRILEKLMSLCILRERRVVFEQRLGFAVGGMPYGTVATETVAQLGCCTVERVQFNMKFNIYPQVMEIITKLI